MELLILTNNLNISNHVSNSIAMNKLIHTSVRSNKVVDLKNITNNENKINYIKGMIDSYSVNINLISLILHQVYINDIDFCEVKYVKWIIENSRKYNEYLLTIYLTKHVTLSSNIISMIQEGIISPEESIEFMIAHNRISTLNGINILEYIFDNYDVKDVDVLRSTAVSCHATRIIRYLNKLTREIK